MRFQRKRGFYERYVKRVLDIICALSAIIVFGWLYITVAILVRVRLGSPILFKQQRPGLIDARTGKERIFRMYKFRSMTDKRDGAGNLLPDKERITRFGRILRASSLDELPEAFNILKGDMSVVGPRPQLVKDMVFMTDEQRMRHTAKPGLSGLAQINGRNAITWEDKLDWDLKYIEKVSFSKDLRIIFQTVKQVFSRIRADEPDKETDLTYDYGDALLRSGKISRERYDALVAYSGNILSVVQRSKQN